MTVARFVLRVRRTRTPDAGAVARSAGGGLAETFFQDFELEVEPELTVLDALELIRVERDPGLRYRHSCHHASCGTCGCLVNGVARLACVTRLGDLGGEEVTLEPLAGFRCEGDLVVDPGPLFRGLPTQWTPLRESEGPRPERRARLEDCIECGLCVSVCPVAGYDRPYLGPAALAAIQRELEKAPTAEEAARLLELADGPRGERLCERAIDCSRVCPSGVAPARRIADLRRRLRHRIPNP
jgi:succinate dehydrogenase / fumarate reductase, iron-sulfur subunit